MNNQQPHSVINSMAGSNQRGVASSQQMYQMQQSNMSQMSHLQQQQQQQQHHPQPQQQSHMMSSYSTQKPSDMSSRQYSPSMSTLNGSAYQPLTGPNLHSGLNMDSNQMGLHQHNEAPSHQYNQQQQQHHHQYPTSLQQQQQQPQQQQQQHQSYQPNVPSQQHQQQLQNQKQMPSHMMQQSHQYNMHQGNPAQQQQQQQAPSQHSQMKPTHQHHQQQQPQQRPQQQPYVHVQQRNMHQQQQQQQPKYDRIQQPRRILQNTNSLNHRPNHRPGVISRDSAMAKDPVVLVTESGVGAGDSAAVKEIEESKDNDITEEQNSEQNITDKSDSASENTELANTKEKTPMTLVQELARFNKIEIKYTLLDEQGPAHKKTFFVKLLLGTEEYSSSGASIRKAQAAAAVMAMKETKYKSPPERKAWRAKRDLTLTEDGKLTPTVELNGLAMKRGESANYKAIEPQQPPYYYPPGMDPRAMYSPRYYHYLRASRDPRFARGYWPMRYHYPRMSRAFYVSLRVGHREFIGDGPTRQAARHNAAIKALKVLKNLPAKEKVEEPEPVVEETKDDDDDDDDDEEDDDLKSRVTSVHEIAFRRKLSVNFEVIRESGPPHMKTFVTRCTVGDMVTEGEGNSKKTSKKIAAEQMYEKFKELTPLPASAVQRKPRTQVYKKKRGIGIKADIQQQKADPNYGSGVNPISRLIQIMCAQKKKEPVYSLVAETGVSCRKEFIMQIEVLDKTCTGSGPNKKLAKRAAAEAMLELLGYNKPTPQPAKSSFKQQHSMEGNGEKKVTFSEYEKGPTEKGNHQKVPGLLHLPSKTIVSVPPAAPGSSAGPPTSSSNFNSKESLVNLSSILKPNWRPELQLRELCKALNYPLEINDITKGQANKSVEYVSRIHVGTNDNRQNFLGSSNSFESARDMACMEALKVLVSRVKDMHPAGDGSAHMKKSVLSRASSGARGGVSQ